MKVAIFFEDKNFLSRFSFDQKEFEIFVKKKVEKFFDFKKIEFLNIIICDNLKIQALNKEYRKLDKPTDVLSFNYADSDLKTGEIYLSYEFLSKQSKDSKKKLDFLLLRALIHGMVHLTGHDHQNDQEEALMQQVETSLLTELREDFKIITQRAASSAG